MLFYPKHIKKKITLKLLFYIFVFSTFITLITTLIHLYVDYSIDMGRIEKRIQHIERSNLKSLSQSLWYMDTTYAQTQLNGLLQLPDIQYLEITSAIEQNNISAGISQSKNILSYTFPLIHSADEKEYDMGSILVIVNLNNVYQRLLNRVVVILGTQAFKTFLVSGFIFIIVQWLITRHLVKISNFVKKLDFDNLEQLLALPPYVEKENELSQVVEAINTMKRELHQKIKSLKESEEQFRAIYEHAPVLIDAFDENGHCILWNNECQKTFGWTVEEINRHGDALSLFYPDPVVRETVIQTITIDPDGHFREWHPVTKDGRIIDTMWANFRLPDGLTFSLGYDITQRNITERNLKLELRINEARADISRELMAVQYDIKKVSEITLKYCKRLTGSDHGFVSPLDKNTLTNVGQAPAEMSGRQDAVKNQGMVFPFDDDGKYSGLWRYALHTQKAFFTNSPGHHPGTRGIPEGSIFFKNFMAVPVISGNSITGLIALANAANNYSEQDLETIRHISELFALALHRQAYESKKKALETRLRQSQKMESVGQLAGGIAHDFNNILHPIIGFTQISQSQLPETHPVQENLTDILNGAKRARDLVKRILLFSRQKEHQLEPMILQPVIKESYKLLRSSIPTNIDIVLDLYNGDDAVVCDATEIHEIIMNLCTNAYHAIADHKGKIIISLKKHRPSPELNVPSGDYLRLSVKDNGAGIPDQIKDRIFEPYVTTKDIGKGSGLGLSVVYGIVESYKGTIRVESNYMQGTEFIIFIPVSKAAPASVDIHNKEVLNLQGNERILLVDDEELIVKMGTIGLKRCGYSVTASTDSREAFRLFKSNPENFDLVITDMAMPGMVGSELSKKILEIRPDIRIIICSGYSERLDKLKTKDLNVSAFLDKPLSVKDLLKITREVLDQSKKPTG